MQQRHEMIIWCMNMMIANGIGLLQVWPFELWTCSSDFPVEGSRKDFHRGQLACLVWCGRAGRRHASCLQTHSCSGGSEDMLTHHYPFTRWRKINPPTISDHKCFARQSVNGGKLLQGLVLGKRSYLCVRCPIHTSVLRVVWKCCALLYPRLAPQPRHLHWDSITDINAIYQLNWHFYEGLLLTLIKVHTCFSALVTYYTIS